MFRSQTDTVTFVAVLDQRRFATRAIVLDVREQDLFEKICDSELVVRR